MTKAEFIENLKEHNRLSDNSENWFKASLAILCIVFILVTSIFDLFDGLLFNILSWLAVLVFAVIMIHGNRTEKKIDKMTSMFCGTCKKRYDEETLAYAVLINECQNCKSAIYET